MLHIRTLHWSATLRRLPIVTVWRWAALNHDKVAHNMIYRADISYCERLCRGFIGVSSVTESNYVKRELRLSAIELSRTRVFTARTAHLISTTRHRQFATGFLSSVIHSQCSNITQQRVLTEIHDCISQGWASECPDVKNYKWWLSPVWHWMRLLHQYGNSGRQRVKPELELPEGCGGFTPPPNFMSTTEAQFWVKVGFKFQPLCKISNISISDPQYFYVNSNTGLNRLLS